MYKWIKSKLEYFYFDKWRFSTWKVDRLSKKHTREEADKLNANYLLKIIKTRNTLPSVSAIYRLKNAQEYLEIAVLSIAPFVKEVIIVDNSSSDNTISIANRLKKQLLGVCKVKIYSYPTTLLLAGKNYQYNLSKKTEGSLAAYYNYAFSLGTSEYLIKCDAHCIFLPKSLQKLQNELRNKPDYISFKGAEIYGRKMSMERYIFKNKNYHYIDGRFSEELKFKEVKLTRGKIKTPVFIHVKRLAFIKHLDSELSPIQSMYK